MYWEPRRTLSYNAIYNMIIGNRGGGKTVGSLHFVLDQYLKSRTTNEPKHFFYLRRYKEELKKLTQMQNGKLFEDIERLGFNKGHKLKCEGNIISCDGKAFGMACALTDAAILKSTPFPHTRIGIFEEFLIDKGFRRYIPNEVEQFLEVDQTIDRDRDQLRWLMLSNAIDVDNNPYFTYWNVDMPYNSTRKLHGNDNQVLVELVADPEFIEKKRRTRRGMLMEGTKYGDYAINAKSLRNDATFIAKKTDSCEYKFTLLYYDQRLGVWFDVKNGVFYISPDVDSQWPIKFSATTDDHKPNVMLLKGSKKSIFIQRLLDAYNKGCVYYETQRVKGWFRDIMRMAL